MPPPPVPEPDAPPPYQPNEAAPSNVQAYNPADYAPSNNQQASVVPSGSSYAPPPPPRPPRPTSVGTDFGDDPSDPTNYTRDPHKLIAYLVTFPKPELKDQAAAQAIPSRFLIYTPPPPPIGAPPEGEKEGKVHKLQRKWQDEVRTAKTTDAKVTSWKGLKGRATKGIDWAMGQTKSSSLEFLNRIPGAPAPAAGGSATAGAPAEGHEKDLHADDGHDEGTETHKTVGLEEMVLVHPTSVTGTQEQIREEFVNSMLRTKTKAQRDAVIATGLIPVTFAIDVLATLIWPFGGLAEIDTVWAVANVRGAKTARSVTKRLNSSEPGAASGQAGGGYLGAATAKMSGMFAKKGQASTAGGDAPEADHKLRLTFVPSARVNILDKYLAGECHARDARRFRSPGVLPTETDVVTAIGWSPSQTGGETQNWEDEQWELHEVKDDVKNVMHKGAREWDKWVQAYEKDPQKALKK